MPADFHSCDINELKKASACYQWCASAEDIRAAQIYVRILHLAAVAGGEDYSTREGLASLLSDATCWICDHTLDENSRAAVDLHLDAQSAIDDRVSEPLEDIKLAAYCYRCLDPETKKKLLLYLKCRLTSLGFRP